jgi:two-component system phosphate regulon sensor histidine kinase PhoR
MSAFWQRALIPPLFIALGALLLWAVAGPLLGASFLALGLLLRVVFHLRRLAALDDWLDDPEGLPVPESSGVWGEVFARLHKMVRQQRKEREQRIAALHEMEQATSALPEGVVILDATDHVEWWARCKARYRAADHLPRAPAGIRAVPQHASLQ